MNQEEIWNEMYKHLKWKKETADLPKIMKGKRILELGAGNGKTLLSILKQKPSSVAAIDFSATSIEKSRKIFGDKVTLIKADARRLPFENEMFDVIVCYYILNNSIKKDRDKIIQEIYRVLKNKGACVFEDFSVNDFRNKGKKHDRDNNTIIKKNGLMCHFFDEKGVKSLFKRFSRVEISTKKFYPIRNSKLKREIINCIAKK